MQDSADKSQSGRRLSKTGWLWQPTRGHSIQEGPVRESEGAAKRLTERRHGLRADATRKSRRE